jgi:dehydrodolichyl diphosphate syntase complex subunit NUS1
MSLISNTCLILVHVSYALFSAVYALFARYSQSPHSLAAARRRVPGHLSLLLTSDDGANEEDVHYVYERAVRDTMRWCRVVGIPRLSAYDPKGLCFIIDCVFGQMTYG